MKYSAEVTNAGFQVYEATIDDLKTWVMVACPGVADQIDWNQLVKTGQFDLVFSKESSLIIKSDQKEVSKEVKK